MTPGRAKSAKAVGRYRLVHELGQSYLGPLWAVRAEGIGGAAQLGTLRLVSLAGLSAETRVRLLEAAWQAMEVRGDFVSPVTDVVASDGELGVVSDYCEGVTLRALANVASVRRKPVPFGVALRMVLDVLDATAALHQASVELGDEAVPLFGGLSADSVLVCTSGRSVVIDAAIASAASEIESLGGTAERVAYAAPEQIASPLATGSGVADARTDVFAVGILAWELFSGRRLFIGSDRTLAQKVLTAKIPKLDEARRKGDPVIPAAVQNAVMKALDRDPARRFQSAAEFAETLAASAGHGTAAADVTEYVTMVAEGPLTRVREALQNAESGTHEAVSPLSARAAQTSTAGKRSSKRPSAAPSTDASPQSVPWAKLTPSRANEATRTRSVPVRPAAAAAPALATPAQSPRGAAPVVEAQSTAITPAAPIVETSVQAVEMAPTPVVTTELAGKVDAPPKAAIPSPRRPSGANKINLPRSPGTPAGRAFAKRPTLQGGWALTQAAIDELAGARTEPGQKPAPQAQDPAPVAPAVAKVAQKPMVKVGASSFGARAGGVPSVTDTLPQPFPSVPPGARKRQATMIGIPLPASPSSPDIDVNQDERTRDFVSPPPSSTRTTEAKDEPKAPEPVPAAQDPAQAPIFDPRLVRPGARAATNARASALASSPAWSPGAHSETTTVLAAVGAAPEVPEAPSAPPESTGWHESLLDEEEEPTHQYNPKDLLRQVEAMGRAGESELLRSPLRERPPGYSAASPIPDERPIGRDHPEPTLPDVLPDVSFAPIAAADVPRHDPRDLEDRQTVAGPAPLDGGYLDEPDGSSVFESTLKSHVEAGPDSIDELLGKPVALSPPQPPPQHPPAAAPFSPAPPEEWAPPQASRVATSRISSPEKPAGFPAPTSLIPSQVPPPLIHDPRANRQATGRVAVPVATPKPGAARWVVVALLSVIVLCASAALSLTVLRGRNAAASRDTAPAPAETTQVVAAPPKEPEPAPAAQQTREPAAAEQPSAVPAASAVPENAPAPADSAEPVASATAEAPAPADSAEPVASATAEAPAPAEVEAKPAAPARVAAAPAPAPAKVPAPAARPPAPVKAAAPAAPRRPAPPKKKSRNVPDDI